MSVITPTNSLTIQGQFTHHNNLSFPFHGRSVVLFNRKGVEIARTRTDKYGSYTLKVADWKKTKEVELTLKVQMNKHFPQEGLSYFQKRKVDIYSQTLKINPQEKNYTFSDSIKVSDFASHFPLQASETAEQKQFNAWSYQQGAMQVKAAIVPKLEETFVKLHEKVSGEPYSANKLMHIFGVNHTHLDAHSSNTTLQLLINGICPLDWKKEEETDEYYVEMNWDKYQLKAESNLPNVKLYAKKENGHLQISRLKVQFLGKEWVEYKADDNDQDYLNALYYANCSFLLFGATFFHLVLGHFIPGVAAVSKVQFFHHPLKKLLDKILEGVLPINEAAVQAVIGDVLAKSNLDEVEIKKLINDHFKMPLDKASYYSFREAVSEDFFLDKAGQDFYESVLSPFFDDYFDNHPEIFDKELHYQNLMFLDYMKDNTPPYISGKERSWYEETASIAASEEFKTVIKQIFFFSIWIHSIHHFFQKKYLLNLNIGSLDPRNEQPRDMDLPQNEVVKAQLSLVKDLLGYRGPLLTEMGNDPKLPELDSLIAKLKAWCEEAKDKHPEFYTLVDNYLDESPENAIESILLPAPYI
jgi:hypothetical protein